ncbi:unnamed protein product, partial [Discosporangium mesarthrocarpum]
MDMLVSSALEPGSSLPSFFEMFMARQIQLSLKPAARHGHGALASRWTRLHRLSPWFDEAYMILTLIVEGHFLANHDCLLAESFYGLRRCRYQAAGDGLGGDAHASFSRNGAGAGSEDRLRGRDRRVVLLVTALVPYVLAKLEGAYLRREAVKRPYAGPACTSTCDSARGDQEGGEVRPRDTAPSALHDDRQPGQRLGQARDSGGALERTPVALEPREGILEGLRRHLLSLRRLFFQVYPLLHLSYEGTHLAYQWTYLFRGSAYFSPELHLMGMVVRRSSPSDWEATSPPARGARAGVGTGAGGGAGGGSVLNRLLDRAGRYGRVALVAAVVGFKIMEWWTAMEAQ